ncbi:MAG: CBS domain-containing protein [Halobacteriota archaeon]
MRYDKYAFNMAADIASSPYTVDKSDRISYALECMEKHKVNQLFVTSDNELVGVITKQGIASTLGRSDDVAKPASSLHVARAMDEALITISRTLPIGEVSDLMKHSEVLAVVDDQLSGWITFEEIVKASRPSGFAGEIMDPPVTCSPYDRVVHIRRRMIDESIWWMMVVDDNQLIGVITENDIARAMSQFRDVVKQQYQDARVRRLVIDDIMVTDMTSVRTNTPCAEVVDTMLKNDVEGVPVLDLTDAMVGMITKGTILKNLD